MKKIFLVFIFFLMRIAAFSQNPDSAQLKKTIEYGLSSAIYWEDGFSYWANTIDPSMKKNKDLKENIGSFVDGDLWVSKAKTPVKIYYLLLNKIPCSYKEPLAVELAGDGQNFWFVECGAKKSKMEEDCSLLKRNISISVPENWAEIAKAKVALNKNEMSALKGALKSYVEKYNRKYSIRTNHFYLGPLNQMSTMAWIYWKEGEELISLPIDDAAMGEKGGRDFEFATPAFEKIFHAGKNENDTRIPFLAERKVRNCVKDGTLLIVR